MLTPSMPLPTRRADLMARLAQETTYDLAIVGGGATGLGVALDAAARGFSVLLVESHDFAKGTSSRATKLVHGGVRYLAQGNIGLVREALHERTTLLRNAPHIAQPLTFVVPTYQWWEAPFYGAGLTAYDVLAGSAGLGKTQFLNAEQTRQALPGVKAEGLKGGVRYWDGQFNDARLAIALARTAAAKGALLVNYCKAVDLLSANGRVCGLVCEESIGGKRYEVKARCVINAAGVWVDALREKDGQAHPNDGRSQTRPMVAPSQGVHVVVDRSFLGGHTALMVPKTADGRVLFAVPWLGRLILGTTDTPRHDLAREPLAFDHEVDFILKESARYLNRTPTPDDIQSLWVGLRPLVKPQGEEGENTKELSREHTILVSRSGLVTVTGGKWTTYRAMAEDVLAHCFERNLLGHRPAGHTLNLPMVGATNGKVPHYQSLAEPEGLHSYGDEAEHIESLPGAERWLCPELSEAMVRFAARCEYAMTTEDVLARRSRVLFWDARLAERLAEPVGRILEEETGSAACHLEFASLAQQYFKIPGQRC